MSLIPVLPSHGAQEFAIRSLTNLILVTAPNEDGKLDNVTALSRSCQKCLRAGWELLGSIASGLHNKELLRCLDRTAVLDLLFTRSTERQRYVRTFGLARHVNRRASFFLLKPFLFKTSLCSRERRGFCCVSGIFRSITVCDAKFSRRWQQSGNRRGWTTHEDIQHQAWLRVLQGRRPPSVQWPRARPQQHSLQSGQSVVNEGLKSTQKTQTMRTAGLRPFVDASAKQTMAGDRVTKIKHALQVLGDTEGPEVDGLRAALKRAESDTKVTPIHVQVKECESFLSRARKHMEELDQKRAVVGASISDAEKRLVALKSQEACMSAPSAPSDALSEVQRLQDLVSQLQAKIDAQGQDPDVPCVPTVKRFCRSGQGHVQVPLMPNSIPEHLVGGATCRDARCSHEWRDHTCPGIEFQIVRRCRTSDGDHRWCVFVKVRVAVSREARCGYRGRRGSQSSRTNATFEEI